MTDYKCICDEPKTPIILENELAYARFSNPNFGPGHIVILPKAHRKSLEEITSAEVLAIRELKLLAKKKLQILHPALTDIAYWENDGPHRSDEHYHCHVIANTGEPPYVVTIDNLTELSPEQLERQITEFNKVSSLN